MLKRVAVALLALGLFGSRGPAFADDAPVVYAEIPAHPALWTVHGPKGTAYLFGSIHALPAQVDWHTKEIDAAMAKADVMVFELAMDKGFKDRIQTYVRERGMLPPGQHLRDLLSPDTREEFDSEIADLGISKDAIDRMRPWLAALTMDVADMQKHNYSSSSGIETQLEGSESKDTRPIIGLETVEQQLTLLAPSDPRLELQSFEATLKAEGHSSGEEVGPLLDAWIHGDVARLDRLMGRDLAHYPKARKLLLDDRNKAWAAKISGLLGTGKTYFITVGAAHLGGRRGVPNLLRAKGFRVEGP
jgi:uncharacterized protein YbaP (TraB family)